MLSFVDIQMYGLFKISALNVISGVMSGMRYARDDKELQALVNNLDELVRRSFRSGKISNIFPILKRLFPRITGSNEIIYYIKNAYNFIQVCEVITIVVMVTKYLLCNIKG